MTITNTKNILLLSITIFICQACLSQRSSATIIKKSVRDSIFLKNEKPLNSILYDSTRSFSNGAAAVKLNGKWGFIDTTAKVIIPIKYEKVTDFIEDVTEVYLNNIPYFINKKSVLFRKPTVKKPLQFPVPANNITGLSLFNRNISNYARLNTGTASCPANVDFEFGNFMNWKCDTGSTYSIGTTNYVTTTTTVPTIKRHTLISRSNSSNALDPYGNFPVNAPNGSGYTLKLGNDSIGGFAEKVRYVIHVPVNSPDYSITFQYAVVFENPNVNTGGVHEDWQQPRFTANMIDSALNDTLDCASFLYVASLALQIPGFSTSPILGHLNSPIRYKPWDSVYVNLSKYPGRTLYFDLTTADCTLKGHFGYAYVDVSECGIAATSTYNCVSPNITTLTGPPGFQAYKWYDSTFNSQLGNSRILTLNPGPPLGTKYYVVVKPYNNTQCVACDCTDTLQVRVSANYPNVIAGPDLQICNGQSVLIGNGVNITGFTYNWSPATGVSNTGTATTNVSPTATTTYTLQITDNATRCNAKDSVIVTVKPKPQPDFTINQANQCIKINSYQFSNTTVSPGGTATYYWTFGDGNFSNLSNPNHVYSSSGNYLVKLIATANGCSDSITKQVTVYATPVPNFSVNAASQCLAGNLFQFTGTSILPPGTYTYLWNFGDGSYANTLNSSHSFSNTGSYNVALTVTNDKGCKDSIVLPITVVPMPQAIITTAKTAFCTGDSSKIDVHSMAGSGTILSYQWYKDGIAMNGAGDSILIVYQAGVYTIAVKNTFGCITTSAGITITVYPLPVGSIIPPSSFIICEGYPVILSATGGTTYQWFLNGLSISGATSSTYLASNEGTYTVQLISVNGCKAMATNNVFLKLIKSPIAQFDFQNYCINLPVYFNSLFTSTSGDSVKLNWNFGDGTQSTIQNPTHFYTSARSYRVSLVATSASCIQLSDTVLKTIFIERPITGIRYPTVNAVNNKPQQLDARPFGNIYLWQPSVALNNYTVQNPVFTYHKDQEYLIRITKLSSCIITDTVLVRVFKDGDIYVPRAWSPNNDGHNDRLYPIITGMMQLKVFRIFNRWGRLMFETSLKGDGWNGIFSSVNQPSETYTWTVEATDPDGHLIKRAGNSVLIR